MRINSTYIWSSSTLFCFCIESECFSVKKTTYDLHNAKVGIYKNSIWKSLHNFVPLILSTFAKVLFKVNSKAITQRPKTIHQCPCCRLWTGMSHLEVIFLWTVSVHLMFNIRKSKSYVFNFDIKMSAYCWSQICLKFFC